MLAKGVKRRGVAADQLAWTIEEYLTERGENLVLSFLSRLSRRDKVEAIALLKLLRERGNTLRLPTLALPGRWPV